jgi:hypothetical protein
VNENIQSTCIKASPLPLATSLDVSPAQEPLNATTDNIFITPVTENEIRKPYSDQTGKFPARSSSGNQYIFVLYDYDSNIILTQASIPNRQAKEITNAWTRLHAQLRANSAAPTLHVLDNECSDELKKAFLKYNIKFQLVPPHSHRRNAAECAIQTWKAHNLTLATYDPKFPLTEWDRLLSQATLTLNLLRSSRRQPKLLADAALFGNFDFNATPLAPPGTRVLVHETLEQKKKCATFSLHAVESWYIGPSPDHYRCFKS